MTNVVESWRAVMTPDVKRAYIDRVLESGISPKVDWEGIFKMKTKEEWLKEYVPGRVEDLIDAMMNMMAKNHPDLFGGPRLKVQMTGIVSDGPLPEITGSMNASEPPDAVDQPIPLPTDPSQMMQYGQRYIDNAGKIWTFRNNRLESA